MSDEFVFIDGEKDSYPLVKMCDWLDLSKSGHYEWRDCPFR